jgi:hypothetical protein
MPGQVPTVFLSSTFYDLRQVRADLTAFIEEQLGYRVLASELPSFPVEPDASTIENCRRRVRDDADLLILVIGGRYGSVDSNAKSVTNLEYLAARAKRIPVYAFVQQDVLAVLPTWEGNPDADFSRTVDTPELFKFLKQVRSVDNVWMFPFGTAQDIVRALRPQLAFLMLRGLRVQSQLRGEEDQYRGLIGTAFQIALEQPNGWEGKLLAQLVADEIALLGDVRHAYETGLAFGVGEHVEDVDTPAYAQRCLAQAESMTEVLTNLVETSLDTALSTKDVRLIAYSAREIGRVYREAMDWAARIRRANVEDDWKPVLREMSMFTRDIVLQIEGLPSGLNRLIDEAIADPSEEPKEVTYKWGVTLYNMEAFQREMALIKRKRGIL